MNGTCLPADEGCVEVRDCTGEVSLSRIRKGYQILGQRFPAPHVGIRCAAVERVFCAVEGLLHIEQ